jgi:DNA-binding cell septation regulator SpoVG
MSGVTLTEFQLSPADAEHRKTGLMGWVSFTINDTLRLDGVTVRRTAGGRLTLAFPSKIDRNGRKRSLIRPISEDARLDIEDQVFSILMMDARGRS